MIKSSIKIAVLLLLAVACKPKDPSSKPNAGDIDPSKFVAVGGSVTAGFLDDGLSYEGQQNSLAAILANQLSLVGATGFSQPFLPESSVGINLDGNAPFKLGYKTDCENVTSLSPIRKAISGDQSILTTNIFVSSFRNMGVPHLKSIDLNTNGYGNSLNGPGNFNPFFARMTSNQSTSSVMQDILAIQPTFFSFFMGMDEVLLYAKKGGAMGGLTPVNGPAGVGFDGSIAAALNELTANGAKGVVGTIPDVTEMPYFTTIPYDGLDLDAESAETLNEVYNPIGIFFNVGKNPFVIEDPSAGLFGVRLMEEGELILLSVPLDSVKCYKMGSVFPFRNEFVLTNAEINSIRNTVDSYNDILVSKAQSIGLAVADVHGFYKKFKSGIVYNGVSMNSKFVSGGAYSLDGIHLNPKANALLANEFIKAINTQYNATIPFADASKYRGVIFP
jgi:hypothetical protein